MLRRLSVHILENKCNIAVKRGLYARVEERKIIDETTADCW